MQAAEHGADFPMAKKVRGSMSHDQMHDFAVGSEADKPEHVVKGQTPDVVHANTQTYKNKGQSEREATVNAIKASKKGHPNRHKNLGKFLHKKKQGDSEGGDLD